MGSFTYLYALTGAKELCATQWAVSSWILKEITLIISKAMKPDAAERKEGSNLWLPLRIQRQRRSERFTK
jgi:hypothetical protein